MDEARAGCGGLPFFWGKDPGQAGQSDFSQIQDSTVGGIFQD